MLAGRDPNGKPVMSHALLDLDGVTVVYRTRGRPDVRAVDRVSLRIRSGETYALIGESGSGKSTVAKAVLGLEPVHEGSVEFVGQRVESASRSERKQLRRDIQAVFQDPHSALNPRMTMVQSVMEPLLVHGEKRRPARERSMAALDRVGIDATQALRFPHQLSGGQKQRVNIARALVLEPRLVICDEAVSALDVSLQAEVLNLLRALQDEGDLTYFFITHDISLLPHIANRVGVLYLGRLVEQGTAREIVEAPAHPYTRSLVASVPEIGSPIPSEDVVHGEIPDPSSPPTGCRFHPRCPYAVDRCRVEEPELLVHRNGRLAACHRVDENVFDVAHPGPASSEAITRIPITTTLGEA